MCPRNVGWGLLSCVLLLQAACGTGGWEQLTDAGLGDAGGGDAGLVDAGFADAGFADAGFADAGFADAGFADAGGGDGGLADAGSGAGDAGSFIVPDDPGAADVQMAVDARQTRPISPYVYGHNHPDWSGPGHGFTFTRAGGNRFTAYNWETNASNAGSDWCHQNDGFLGGAAVPGEAVRARVAAAHGAGASVVVTVPIVDHLAADKAGGTGPPECSGDVAKSGADYLTTRFVANLPQTEAPRVDPPDLNDGQARQDEFVAFLERAFPQARTDPRRTIFYCLDNEPGLWSDTHARIHPGKVRYDELLQRSIAYASAIKDVAPGALVFGPVSYGWQGLVNLQEAPDAGGRDFVEFYLTGMRLAGEARGGRLLDVLDLHWYPEAQGDNGVRILADDVSPQTVAARVQAPRSLWDPTYTERSWITQWSTQGPIALLPRLQAKLDAFHPGTRIAVTEYYYGGGDHISGALAQADVLGVFGREGVFAASLWHLGDTTDRFILGAFRMYRDYDGAGGAFGDTGVLATTSDAARTSAYASLDASGRLVLVLVNRDTSPLTVGLSVTHGARLARARVHQLTAADDAPARLPDVPFTLTNALHHALPAQSVTTLVLEP